MERAPRSVQQSALVQPMCRANDTALFAQPGPPPAQPLRAAVQTGSGAAVWHSLPSLRARSTWNGSLICAGMPVALRPSMRSTPRSVLALATALCAGPALADGLVVHPLEHNSWTESVAALQRDASSEGRVIHVAVRDDAGRTLPCGGYTLRLDPVAARAFTVGECDLETNATAIRLTQRAALFASGPNGQSPVGAVVSALPTLSAPTVVTTANAGGTAAGARANAATPAAPAPTAATTTATTPSVAAAETEATNSLPAMMFDRPTDVPSVTRVSTRCVDAPRIAAGVVLQGTTVDGRQQPVYQLRLADRSTFTLNIATNFGGSVNIFRRCPESGTATIRHSSVFGVGPDQRITWDLGPGTYYVVIVDADVHPHRGMYSVRTDVEPDYLAFWRR